MDDASCSLGVVEAVSLKMVEHSPDANIVINTKRTIIIFNARAELLFGYDRSDVVGQNVEVLLPERLRETHVSHIARYMTNPQKRVMGAGQTLLGLHQDGSEFPVLIELSPFPIAGAGVHVLAVVRRTSQ